LAEQITKQQLLKLIGQERERLERVVAQVPPQRLEEPTLEGGWSLKDTLAHLSWWERRTAHALRSGALSLPDTGPLALAASLTYDDTWVDRVNALVYQHYRQHPANEVLEEFRRAHEEMLAALSELHDEDLADDGELNRRIGGSVLQLIRGDTDEHYVEHREALERWLGEQ
jgi:uncharacterized protein (TIGR03083 family)